MLTLLVHPSIRPSASVDERQSLQARRVVVTVRCAAWYFGYPRARIKSFDVSVMLGLRPSSHIKRLLRFTLKRFVDYIQHKTRKEKKGEKNDRTKNIQGENEKFDLSTLTTILLHFSFI